jgi:long-chain acyl-CoA synthetase
MLARGAVAQGYRERPDATSRRGTRRVGSGDISEFDADGFLRITDRKKDLLKTSGGKYIAPQKIENLLKLQPHVSQAVVIGDQRKYCVALLTLDVDEMSLDRSGTAVRRPGGVGQYRPATSRWRSPR